MANLSASDLAGLRIRQARQRRDWTAKELADHCAAAGAPQITPTVITNLETRRRKTRELTVDEMLVLAHVLDVPPLQLIVPLDPEDELEILPGINLDAQSAADWIVGNSASVGLNAISGPEPSAADHVARWQERLVRLVGREVLRHRNQRRLSARQVADRTAELGMPVPRSGLADLESGRGATVAVAEIMVLAAALDVAPVELICPVGFDKEIELLPGRMMDPLMASRWVDGELVLDVSGPEAVFRTPAAGDESTTRLAEHHAALLEQVDVQDAEAARCAADIAAASVAADMADAAAADALHNNKDPATAAALKAEADKSRRDADEARAEYQYRARAVEQYREIAAQSLRLVRAEMRRRGMILPPLPPFMKDKADGADGGGN